MKQNDQWQKEDPACKDQEPCGIDIKRRIMYPVDPEFCSNRIKIETEQDPATQV